jgi:hypothetical protein
MKYLLAIFVLTGLFSCTEKEKPLETLDKKSAREVTLKTVTQGDSVLHITTQNIWYNGERIVAKNDTIITAKSPNTWDTKDSLKTLNKVPIYVTVQ